MPLKIECHSKWDITQNVMSLEMECHSKWNIAQNGMSFKMEFHFEMDSHSKKIAISPFVDARGNKNIGATNQIG